MPAHLRRPEPRRAQRLGALALAFVVGALVMTGLGGEPADEATTALVRPASDVSTGPTVLSEVIERTTLPLAPPASAEGFTTTTVAPPTSAFTPPAPPQPAPTLAPPVSITRPPDGTTTTTTAPPPSTTEPDLCLGQTTTTTDPACDRPLGGTD